MAGMTWVELLSEERSTNRTPSLKLSTSVLAASTARRVLPLPPAPVSVNNRISSRKSRSWTSISSRSRPSNLVGGAGSEWSVKAQELAVAVRADRAGSS
jgi:hypothetical protein